MFAFMKHKPFNRRTNDLKDAPSRLFLVMLGAFFLFAVVVAATGAGLSSSGLINLHDIAGQTSSENGRQWLRLYLMLSNLLPFAATALLALVIVFQKRWKAAAGLAVAPPQNATLVATLFFLVALPMVGWLAYLNLQLPLPDWMQRNEENTDILLKGILNMTTVPEFVLAFITVAITPAIGEELLLRGVVQRRILRPFFGNPHLAIWVAAILFSAMHLEFGGFAPRMVLGVLLGYAYYWTRSLWVPIGLHLLFNGLQVIAAYVSGNFDPEAELTDTPAWWMGVGSLILVVVLGVYAERNFVGADEQDQAQEEWLADAD